MSIGTLKRTEMSIYNPNIYEQQILAKGRDLPKASVNVERKVPAHLQDRYATWDEYQEALHDFLNGN